MVSAISRFIRLFSMNLSGAVFCLFCCFSTESIKNTKENCSFCTFSDMRWEESGSKDCGQISFFCLESDSRYPRFWPDVCDICRSRASVSTKTSQGHSDAKSAKKYEPMPDTIEGKKPPKKKERIFKFREK